MNRVVVITGGTSGIGEACAKEFTKNGDTVVVMSRKNNNHSQNFFMCDVSIDAMVHDVLERIHDKFGDFDILINNAGYGVSGAVELIDEQESEGIIDVNYFGVLNCIKHAIPFMKKGSKIINMSSACALFPLPFRALYCASKSAVNNLSFSVAMEVKPLGIDVIAVCPGDVKTNFTRNRVKVNVTNEHYGARIKNAAEAIDSREDKRMSPEVVGKRVYKISNKKHPKPMFIVGAKYKFLYFLTKIFPKRWIYGFIYRYFGGFKPVKKSK